MKNLAFVLLALLFVTTSCREDSGEPVLTDYTENFNVPQSPIEGVMYFQKSDNDRLYLKKINFSGTLTEPYPITKIDMVVKAENDNPHGSPFNEPIYIYTFIPTTPVNSLDFDQLDVQPQLFVGRNEFPMKKLNITINVEKQQGAPTLLVYTKNY
ncbi:hypothetical protein J8J42_12595 [Chryseobacterium sp. cx-311]|uniref:hypothetical protein n=1 Tax=Marnyiella aurantia TaxID=2758037 RepID=UPI001AE18ECE|nr:hypothetical protein [Marnyiella aurantia]MBP0613877.1 hypothetical protein [Marnyiella aurantia]